MPVISAFRKYITGQKGALAPAFAVLLPALIAMMAFGVDCAQALSQKARLARAVSEASLAVAATGKYEMSAEEMKNAEQMITHYIDYYFPEKLAITHLNIASSFNEINQDSFSYTGYDISAVIKVPILFTAKMVSGLERDLEIGSGSVKIKKFSSVAADYVFVVDFSSSSAQSFTDLKSVVKEVSDYALKNNPENKIALVPYSLGVPVKLPGKNQRGGQRVGCSLLFVPNEGYDIDYAFWGDKNIDLQSNLPFMSRMFRIDNSRYQFYRYYVGGEYFRPEVGMDINEILARWCTKNKKYGQAEGRAQYSCKDESYPDDDIFSARSQRIIASEAAKARDVVSRHYTLNSLFNDAAINYPATLEKMFYDSAIITFPLLWSHFNRSSYRPFVNMCISAGGYTASNDLSKSIPTSWLIELTSDKSEMAQVETMKMPSSSWTQISSGLVRSVPVMMKGRNKRKIFIIISRRVDYLQPNADVTEKWLKQYQLCEKIKEGIKQRSETNTSRVEMYFISYPQGVTPVPIKQAKEWNTIWAEHCVGTNNAAAAEDKEALLKTIKGFMNDETGHFAN